MKRIVLITFLVIFSIYNICYIYSVIESINETYDYAEYNNPLWAEAYPVANKEDPYMHNHGVLMFFEQAFTGQECFEYLFNNSFDISNIDFYYDDNHLSFSGDKSFFEYYKQNNAKLDEKDFEVFITGINEKFYIDEIAIAETNVNKEKNLKLDSYYESFRIFYESQNLSAEQTKPSYKRDICGLFVCVVVLILNIVVIVLVHKKKKVNLAILIFLIIINIVCMVAITEYYNEVGIIESQE